MTDALKKLNEEMATNVLRISQYEKIIDKLVTEIARIEIEIRELEV